MHFELVRQISIALENTPGALHRAASELARLGINIHGISVLDSIDQGRARDALSHIGLNLIEADVFEFDLPDTPGRLADVCRALAEGGVNIDYAYGTSHVSHDRMRIMLKASPLDRAAEVFKKLPPE
jgi:hypothetical protein